MKEQEETAQPKPARWKGLLASFFLAGAGQFLQGRRFIAGFFLIAYLLTEPLALTLLAASFIPPWLPLLLGPLFCMGFIWMLWDAFRRTQKIGWKRWLVIVLIAVLLNIFDEQGIMYFFRIYNVPVASMSPTIETGDLVFCLRSAYWHDLPKHGDIIVFSSKDIPALSDMNHGQEIIYLKRVVGLPGDVLKIRNNFLFINGVLFTYPGQKEQYAYPVGSRSVIFS